MARDPDEYPGYQGNFAEAAAEEAVTLHVFEDGRRIVIVPPGGAVENKKRVSDDEWYQSRGPWLDL